MEKSKMKPYSVRYSLQSLMRLIKLLWSTGRKTFIFILLIFILAGLMPVLFLNAFKDFVNSAIAYFNGSFTLWPAVMAFLVLLVNQLVSNFSAILSNGLALRQNIYMNKAVNRILINKTGRIPLELYEHSGLYNRIALAQGAVDKHLTWVSAFLPTFVTSAIIILSMLGYIGRISPLFPLLLIISSVPITILDLKFGRKQWKLDTSQTEDERRSVYYEDLMTRHEAAAEIRLFGLHRYLLDKWHNLFAQLNRDRVKLAWKQFNTGNFGQLTTPIGMLLLLLVVVFYIANGKMSLGDFGAYLVAVGMFNFNVFLLVRAASRIYNEILYLNDFFSFIDNPLFDGTNPVVPAPTRAAGKETGDQPPAIRLDSVSFFYHEADKPAVNNVNLEILNNECIALVGANGSGKTTLAKLILGLYRPSKGNIIITGESLTTNSRRMSAIFQDYMKYELSAGENIGFGAVDCLDNKERIKQAAEKSNAAEFIEQFPDKYETILGKSFDNKGMDISVGQWQRLSIGRAYMGDAPVLVLDEPTAALDPRAEAEVYHQFREMARDKLVILISHRLGSTKIADRIIVMDQGAIIEQGTHEALMKLKGQYEKMYTAQAQWYV